MRHVHTRHVLSLAVFASLVAGCTTKNDDAGKIPLGQVASAAPASPTVASDGSPIIGTVLEQIPAGQYVYLRIKIGKGDVWTAVPATQVAVGAEVRVTNPMLM